MYWSAKPALTLPQQFLLLRNNPICVGEGSVNHRRLVWNYRVRPTLLSREYAVQIFYERDDGPKVLVRDPELSVLAGGRDLPHVYKHPTRLCLYLPGSGEWIDTMRVDQTFVPWTVTWLFYFEEWLESNDWKGGGEHPGDRPEPVYNRRVRRGIR